MRILREDTELLEANRKLLLEFVEYCQAQGFEVPTIVRHIFCLRKASKILNKSFRDATKDDLVRTVAEIEKVDLSDRTKLNEKISLKRFYKWLNGDEEFPEQVKWIKTSRKKGNRILPESLLTEEEVRRIAETAMNQRDRALVLVLYESGCRVGEILSLRLKNVQFDKYGAVLVVDGKTGPRRVRIISSAPALANWLDHHPHKDDQNAALWISFDKVSSTQPLQYYACRKMLRELALRAHINKKVNPHSFRHARASRLANSLTESQMKEYLGWTQDSNMASVYVHLSGRDIDNALLRVNGVKVETKEEDSALRIVKCMRCETDNSPASRFCTKCGTPLDLRTAIELQDGEKMTDAVMNILMEDKAFRDLVHSRKREIILMLAQQRTA
jgi:integrase/ribosomal protein L40E